MLDVGNVRHAVHQLRDVGVAAGGFELAAAVELVGEGHQVDGLLRLAEDDHLLVDAPVVIVKEVFGLQLFERGVERVVVEQDRAEDAALRLRVLRQLSFERRGWGGHWKFALYSPVRAILVKRMRESAKSVKTRSTCLAMREDDCRFSPIGAIGIVCRGLLKKINLWIWRKSFRNLGAESQKAGISRAFVQSI